MLKLAEIIREGLKIKRARKEEQRKVDIPEVKPKAKPAMPTAPPAEIKVEPVPKPPPVEAIPEIKEKTGAESPIALINKEIESLELTTDIEEQVHRIGNLATLNFKDLEGCNPVMAATRIKEAVKESLLKKYDVDPGELEKNMGGFKKKFHAFGTHCYVNILKQKI